MSASWADPEAFAELFGILTQLISRHHRTEAARYRALRRAPVDPEVGGGQGVQVAAVAPRRAGASARGGVSWWGPQPCAR
ncbi:hypothetical protein [Nonomuraea mesophila]|uniref:hypothetical protein n=1 Tax=Nonomuraea mesophila TaxID=2530382 RepID=UPI001FE8DF7B|nr:hypothetical protein [Nonomuraea mesophila]